VNLKNHTKCLLVTESKLKLGELHNCIRLSKTTKNIMLIYFVFNILDQT